MKKIASLLYIFLLLITSSCVSEFNAQLPDDENNLLVVEGNIIGDSLLQFSFSRSFSLSEQYPPAGYNGVQVNLVIVGSNGYRSTPAYAVGGGTYMLRIEQLDEDVAYGIEFEYEEDTYRSELMKPLRTPAIDSISWSQPVEEGDVSIRVSTHDTQERSAYFMWQYVEDWEINTPYYTSVMYDPGTNSFSELSTAPYYYCWKQKYGNEILIGSTVKQSQNRILNHTLFKHSASSERFSILYSVYIKQQAISKAGYEYYLDLSKGNSGMGGLFTPQPSEIEGNITCITNPQKKVIGHIEVTHNISTYRMFLSRSSISKGYVWEDCQVLEEGDIAQRLSDGFTYLDLYNSGYRPVMYDEFKKAPGMMALSQCTDCRERGGSKTKPSFWPNDHQ